MNDRRDTIFALSSGRPPAAIAVVRLSGPGARNALEALLGRVPEPRRATLARVRDPAGEVIDQALALWFPGPASETGEDVAELQLHGGRAVIAAVLRTLGGFKDFRLAEPGEFTRRAFENGRLDLTQVEALADLVDADTEAQRRQASAQLRGGLANRTDVWRQRLIEALALIEAGIDFPDEGDIPLTLIPQAMAIVEPLVLEIEQALTSAARGERLRDGLWVVIAGPPNAGKSTLLNRIARREAAIVSPIAGTTRDAIEVHLDLNGYPVNLIDTAGIREPSHDPIEREGMRRARESAARADLVLWIMDASDPEIAAAVRASKDEAVDPTIARWIVVNKIDLLDQAARQRLAALVAQAFRQGENVHYVSAATGAGLDDLITAIVRSAETTFRLEPALVTRERQRVRLQEVRDALVSAMARAGRQEGVELGVELVAEDLRLAMTSLGKLTGRVDVEEVLEVIFRDFCVGK